MVLEICYLTKYLENLSLLTLHLGLVRFSRCLVISVEGDRHKTGDLIGSEIISDDNKLLGK